MNEKEKKELGSLWELQYKKVEVAFYSFLKNPECQELIQKYKSQPLYKKVMALDMFADQILNLS
jgi:hypothetical protein